MYLVDANVLLSATDSTARDHESCRGWLETVLNGHVRVGLPAQSLGAFLRISTHPRVMEKPLTAEEAWAVVAGWLDAPAAWVPDITDATLRLLGDLIVENSVTGNLVPDAQLAALALEHGLTIATLDSDFTRFPVRLLDPRNP